MIQIIQSFEAFASTVTLRWGAPLYVVINIHLSAIATIWKWSDVQNDQWFTRIIETGCDSLLLKIYTGWFRRLNGQGSSKHLICIPLFVYMYGNVCKTETNIV